MNFLQQLGAAIKNVQGTGDNLQQQAQDARDQLELAFEVLIGEGAVLIVLAAAAVYLLATRGRS